MIHSEAITLIKILFPQYSNTDIQIHHVGEAGSDSLQLKGSFLTIEFTGNYQGEVIVIWENDIAYYKRGNRELVYNAFEAYRYLKSQEIIQ